MLTKLDVPKRLRIKESFQAKLEVQATATARAKVRLYADDQMVGEQTVNVKPGRKQVVFQQIARKNGYVKFRAELEAADDTIAVNNRLDAYSEVKGLPAILLIENTPNAGKNLAAALEATGMKIERKPPAAFPEDVLTLRKYSSIILTDTPADVFSEAQLKTLQSAVQDLGVGLVTTGGENSYALGGWFETPLEEILPVRMDLQDKQRSPSLGLVLAIDKSGSMQGDKIELAKEAGVRSTKLLQSHDRFGLLAFDDQNQWIVKPKPPINRRSLEGLIRGIPANGGTNIYPALEQAYQEIRKLKVQKKHIILLTDGQSASNKYDALVKKMKQENITLTTVAVGTDADQALLKSLSQLGKGRYYHVQDPQSIPSIISKETMLSKRSYVIQKPFVPNITGAPEWKLPPVPPLRAYIGTTAKQTADVVLASEYPDPIAARWQIGLGRTIAWTSDVNGKWSKAWVTWPQFARFWSQMVSWTFPQVETHGWNLEVQQQANQTTLQLVGPPDQSAGITQMKLQFGQQHEDLPPVTLKPTRPGRFTGVFPTDEPGTYVMRGELESSKGKKQAGVFVVSVPYSNEYRLSPLGLPHLKQLAALGGGQLHNKPKQAFEDILSNQWTAQDISFALFLLAALLWPIDIAIRRLSWHTLWETFRRRTSRQTTLVTPSSLQIPIARLRSKRKHQATTSQLRQQQKTVSSSIQTNSKHKTPTKPLLKPKTTTKQTNDTHTHLTGLLAAKRKRERK